MYSWLPGLLQGFCNRWNTLRTQSFMSLWMYMALLCSLQEVTKA